MARTLAAVLLALVPAVAAAATPAGVPVPPAGSFAALPDGSVLLGDLEGGPRLIGGSAARRARFAAFGYRTVRPAGPGLVLVGDVFDGTSGPHVHDHLVRLRAGGRVDRSYGRGGRATVAGPRGATFTIGTDGRGSAAVVFRRDENVAGSHDLVVALDSRGHRRYARELPTRFITYASDPIVSGAAVAVFGTSARGRPELALATPSRLRIVALPADQARTRGGIALSAIAEDGAGGFVLEGRTRFLAISARGAMWAFGATVRPTPSDAIARDAAGRLLVGSPGCTLRWYADGALVRTWRAPRRAAPCSALRAQAAGGRVLAIADYATPDPAHDDVILHPRLFRLPS